MPGLISAIAAVAAVGAAAGAMSSPRPVRLVVQSEGGSSIIRVVADSKATCKATYQLEVSGNGGGNRSVNRGTVSLPTSGPVAIATVKIANGNAAATIARLSVTPCDGEAYEQVWTGQDGAAPA